MQSSEEQGRGLEFIMRAMERKLPKEQICAVISVRATSEKIFQFHVASGKEDALQTKYLPC